MDPWVSLFSGGKDSSWALYRALEADRPVERLVTVHPAGKSFMYHVPATELASLAAESIGLPLVDVRPEDFDAGATSPLVLGLRFAFRSVPWLTGAALAASTGRLLDELIRREGLRSTNRSPRTSGPVALASETPIAPANTPTSESPAATT